MNYQALWEHLQFNKPMYYEVLDKICFIKEVSVWYSGSIENIRLVIVVPGWAQYIVSSTCVRALSNIDKYLYI